MTAISAGASSMHLTAAASIDDTPQAMTPAAAPLPSMNETPKAAAGSQTHVVLPLMSMGTTFPMGYLPMELPAAVAAAPGVNTESVLLTAPAVLPVLPLLGPISSREQHHTRSTDLDWSRSPLSMPASPSHLYPSNLPLHFRSSSPLLFDFDGIHSIKKPFWLQADGL